MDKIEAYTKLMNARNALIEVSQDSDCQRIFNKHTASLPTDIFRLAKTIGTIATLINKV